MRNVFTICAKELKSYFTSPIAYLLMALFGLIFGYFFFSATVFFVNQGLREQLGGQSQPMSINDYVISPLLGNASVVGLFEFSKDIAERGIGNGGLGGVGNVGSDHSGKTACSILCHNGARIRSASAPLSCPALNTSDRRAPGHP